MYGEGVEEIGATEMTKQEIQNLSTKALRSLIASTNPQGRFAAEVVWAKAELDKRGVNYEDCL